MQPLSYNIWYVSNSTCIQMSHRLQSTRPDSPTGRRSLPLPRPRPLALPRPRPLPLPRPPTPPPTLLLPRPPYLPLPRPGVGSVYREYERRVGSAAIPRHLPGWTRVFGGLMDADQGMCLSLLHQPTTSQRLVRSEAEGIGRGLVLERDISSLVVRVVTQPLALRRICGRALARRST